MLGCAEIQQCVPVRITRYDGATTGGLQQNQAGGNIPEFRPGEIGKAQQTGRDERKFECGAAQDASVPERSIGRRLARLARQSSPWTLRAPAQQRACEPQWTVGKGMVDTWSERMAAGAPDRTSDGPATIEHANRGGEQRQTIDKVGRPVDRVDDPREGRAAAAADATLLPDDRIRRELRGKPLADEPLDGAIRSTDRVGIRRPARTRWFELHIGGLNVSCKDVFTREVSQLRGRAREPFLGLAV